MLHAELRELLVCPTCRGALQTVQNDAGLLCPACKCVYPVRDEIPVMLPEEALPLDAWEREHGNIA